MRIAIVGLNFAPEPTGIAPYTARTASGLAERGHSVRVVTTHPHYPSWRLPDGAQWSTEEDHEGVSVSRVRHYVPKDPRSTLKRAWSETTFGIRALARDWRDADVVIFPSPALISTAVAGARVRGLKRPAVGVIVQDLYSSGITESHDGGGTAARVLTALERRVLRRADGVSVIHDRFRERVVESLGVDPAKVDVIRNWTHLQKPPPFDRDAFRLGLGWRPDEIVLLHSGAMGEKQALSNAVEAARLAEQRGDRMRIVLLGGGGQRPMLEELGAGIATLEFRDPLPGDDYAKALGAADVLLVNEKPGVAEMAVPSKLTSYFSSGRPVVAATEAGSITASEVEASGAGVVIRPGQPEELVSAALRLGEDRHTSSQMGALGPVYCETHLSEEAALDAYDRWVRALHARRQI